MDTYWSYALAKGISVPLDFEIKINGQRRKYIEALVTPGDIDHSGRLRLPPAIHDLRYMYWNVDRNGWSLEFLSHTLMGLDGPPPRELAIAAFESALERRRRLMESHLNSAMALERVIDHYRDPQ